MDFLVYSRSTRAAAGADEDPELNEQHWKYMDGFADAMTARGPILGTDRQTWAGSMHVVDLPGPEAAREFVASEPYNQAGLFAKHHIWRFANVLGRTMWQFAGADNEPRFLVLPRPGSRVSPAPSPLPITDLPPDLRRRLILYGGLRNLDDNEPAGTAMAVQAPARVTLEMLLARTEHPHGGTVEIHDWEFGGPR